MEDRGLESTGRDLRLPPLTEEVVTCPLGRDGQRRVDRVGISLLGLLG